MFHFTNTTLNLIEEENQLHKKTKKREKYSLHHLETKGNGKHSVIQKQPT